MTLNFRPNAHIHSHFKLTSVLSGYKYHVIHRAFWHIKKKHYCEAGIVCGAKNRDPDRNGTDVHR